MSGSSGSEARVSTSTQASRDPWERTIHPLGELIAKLRSGIAGSGLSATESRALDALAANAGAGNPYAGDIAGLAKDLLAGGGPDRTGLVGDAYRRLQDDLAPFARGDFVDPSANPHWQKYLATVSDDVQNRVNGMFAGAGRDLSGANQASLARGIAEGTAPIAASWYDRERERQLGAIDRLQRAGAQTGGLLAQLDQARLDNRVRGVEVAGAAQSAQDSPFLRLLQVEAQRRGIPMQTLSQLAGMLVPIAGLGGSSRSDSQGFQSRTERSDPVRNTIDGIRAISSLFSANPWNLFGGYGRGGRG